MLEGIFGNATAEKVLLYMEQYGEAHAYGIKANYGDVTLSQVQRQLERLEAAGVLVSQRKGRTRLFLWNPRYAFQQEIRSVLRKALRLLPAEERRRYFSERKRPRRTGKPA